VQPGASGLVGSQEDVSSARTNLDSYNFLHRLLTSLSMYAGAGATGAIQQQV
jgi:hypothetical protein